MDSTSAMDSKLGLATLNNNLPSNTQQINPTKYNKNNIDRWSTNNGSVIYAQSNTLKTSQQNSSADSITNNNNQNRMFSKNQYSCESYSQTNKSSGKQCNLMNNTMILNQHRVETSSHDFNSILDSHLF